MQEICLSRFQNKQQTYKTKFIQKLSVWLFHFSSLCHNWLHCSRVFIYATLPPLCKPTLHSLRSSLLPMGQSVHFTSESGCGDLSPGRPGLKLINWKEHCSSYRENFHQHYANKQYCDGELKPFRVSGPDSSVCRCFGEVGNLPTPPGNSQIPAG